MFHETNPMVESFHEGFHDISFMIPGIIEYLICNRIQASSYGKCLVEKRRTPICWRSMVLEEHKI